MPALLLSFLISLGLVVLFVVTHHSLLPSFLSMSRCNEEALQREKDHLTETLEAPSSREIAPSVDNSAETAAKVQRLEAQLSRARNEALSRSRVHRSGAHV